MTTTMWLPPPQALLPPPRTLLTLEPVKLPALQLPPQPRRRMFTCPRPGCGKRFTVNGNLKKHIAAKHEHRKDFICTFAGCNRRFAKKFNMMRHLNVHRTRSRRNSPAPQSPRPRAEGWSPIEMVVASFMADHCDSPRPTQFARRLLV